MRLLTFLLLSSWIVSAAFGAECGSPPRAINLDLGSSRSLLSPDEHWRFISLRPKSNDQEDAILYVRNIRTSQKWTIGSLERDGRAFWSDDSKRLFLRDEYVADDTRIRVFDFTTGAPKEIKGLDKQLRRVIYARVPEDESTLWLYYPQVCFAANDSSTVILTANLPVVRKYAGSEGKDFSLKLTVDLISMQIAVSGPKAPVFKPSK